MEYKSNGDTNCNWCYRYSQKGLVTGVTGNKRTSGDNPSDSINIG